MNNKFSKQSKQVFILRYKLFKTFLSSILLIFLMTSHYSCKDYLSIDDYFSEEIKLDTVFANARFIEAYMWEAASLFPDEGNFLQNNYTPGPLATDEAFSTFLTSDNYNGLRFVLGEITADRMYSFGNRWKNLYQIIRKCNTIFARIDEAKDLTTRKRLQILGTTRFIRAYAYYNILVDFGPPILIGDDILENNETLPYYDRARSTYDEATEYICNELEEAAKILPSTTPLMEFGAPTKGAAYGLVARLRLQHASPLYNGGEAARRTFGNWTRSTDGIHYVSQTYDEKRWAIAAAAAKRVIDLKQYSLHVVEPDYRTPANLPEGITYDPDYYKPWPEGAANIDHFRSYSDMFTGESIIAFNPEFVWGRASTAIRNSTQMSFPQKLGGSNGMCITQKVIDNYAMIDGHPINNSSKKYPYIETGFTSTIQNFSSYRLEPGVSNMYNNREMRFYASVGFSGCFWPMSSTTSVGQYNQIVEYYSDSENGKAGVTVAQNYPILGYVIKKYIHETDAWSGTNARRMEKGFGIIRYAEILLSYAEALNNLTTSHTIEVDDSQQNFSRNIDEIKKAFNQVRHRAGIPGINGTEDSKTIQDLIEKERLIEFLFENRRYYDVRRWGIYEDSESESIRGMNTEASKELYYGRVIPNTNRIGARIINRKLILLPIPLTEVRIVKSLDQNPGWEN